MCVCVCNMYICNTYVNVCMHVCTYIYTYIRIYLRRRATSRTPPTATASASLRRQVPDNGRGSGRRWLEAHVGKRVYACDPSRQITQPENQSMIRLMAVLTPLPTMTMMQTGM